MKPTKMRMTWMVMAFLAVLLSSCNPTELSEIEKASTFAAQTLTAMPEPTETETPTETVVAATSTATPTTEPTLGPVGPTNFPAGV